MAQFQKLGSFRQTHRHAGKGAREQMLPSRHALNTLTSGDTAARSMNDYAKATPGPETPSPDMGDMSSGGVNMMSP